MIYFIRDTGSGRIKIGFAADPWLRLSKIQSDTPGSVAIVGLEDGDRRRERALHATFAQHRTRGEWFAPHADLLAHIATLPATVKRPARGPHVWGDSELTDDTLAPLVGVCRPQINKIRRGISVPSLPVALKIADLTGVSLESLMAPQPVRRAA